MNKSITFGAILVTGQRHFKPRTYTTIRYAFWNSFRYSHSNITHSASYDTSKGPNAATTASRVGHSRVG